MKFDGVDDYIDIPNNTNVNYGVRPQSVSAWIYLQDLTKSGIIGKMSGLYSFDGWYLECVTGGDIKLAFNGDATNQNATSTSHPLTTNTWFHVVANIDIGNTNISEVYVNSVLVASVTDTGNSIVNESNPLRIGMGYQTAPINYFQGYIDDVRMYNRKLSADEIKSLYESRSRINLREGLSGYWRLDEGNIGTTSTGAVVVDRSTNTSNGTPTNGPTWEGSNWINYQ